MEDYNFWQDIFDTFQSLGDGIKIALIITPPITILGFLALMMNYRVAVKKAQNSPFGEQVYSVYRDEMSRLNIFRNGPTEGDEPTVILLDYLDRDRVRIQGDDEHR